jgi:hypothetical protein
MTLQVDLMQLSSNCKIVAQNLISLNTQNTKTLSSSDDIFFENFMKRRDKYFTIKVLIYCTTLRTVSKVFKKIAEVINNVK